MKIRNGFVSNSSSSSFLVSFEKRPKNADEIKGILFGDSELIGHPHETNEFIATKKIADRLFEDFPKRNIRNVNKMVEYMMDGYPEVLDSDFKGEVGRVCKSCNKRTFFMWEYVGDNCPNCQAKYLGLGEDTKMYSQYKELFPDFNDKEFESSNQSVYCPETNCRSYIEWGHETFTVAVPERPERCPKCGIDITLEYCTENAEKVTDYDKHTIKCREIAKHHAKKLLNRGGKIYHFHYSDMEGRFDAIMEHSHIFKRLPFILINKH